MLLNTKARAPFLNNSKNRILSLSLFLPSLRKRWRERERERKEKRGKTGEKIRDCCCCLVTRAAGFVASPPFRRQTLKRRLSRKGGTWKRERKGAKKAQQRKPKRKREREREIKRETLFAFAPNLFLPRSCLPLLPLLSNLTPFFYFLPYAGPHSVTCPASNLREPPPHVGMTTIVSICLGDFWPGTA
jgi:hypothetical protein